MSTQYYIVDSPLPLPQDFNELKSEGLTWIQEHAGSEWTNLNTSDPGVTILDQLVYALTELGYVNDFPVRDILTRPDGKLQVEDQFYLPKEILTITPVTADDFRKYVIDGVNNINNVVVLPGNYLRSDCNIFLYLNGLTGAKVSEACLETFYYLNKSRSLGRIFPMPQPLVTQSLFLSGSIELENNASVSQVLVNIQSAINEYIFPTVTPQSYFRLKASGYETDDIFDGPRLQNGWIPTSSLGEMRTEISAFELVQLIETIDGVATVPGLILQPTVTMPVPANTLLMIDVIGSYTKQYLTITSDQQSSPDAQPLQLSLTKEPAFDVSFLYDANADTSEETPTGSYRDINSYYSIQYTFPEIFRVGEHAVENASDYQVAQSRQLKGYLTLFDQLLANQFSQLANVPKLFSFRNPTTGAPSDRQAFYAMKTPYEKRHSGYPVPYAKFSPTYFYQSLYNVPQIRPLLKGNETFDFSLTPEPQDIQDANSWLSYRLDPYNPYIRGLMEFMEDESTSLRRRNDLLDHLLARHGESPQLFNALVSGAVYSGENLKDRVIFKSLYLQNLGLLSYFKCKGYDFLAADRIIGFENGQPVITYPEITHDFERRIFGTNTVDFIFNSEKIDRVEKLRERDFINYSAIELKLSLLFGLKVLYANFISRLFEDGKIPTGVLAVEEQQALWLIEKRRGLLLIETAMLFADLQFNVFLSDNDNNSYQLGATLGYADAMNVVLAINGETAPQIASQLEAGALVVGTLTYPITKSATVYPVNAQAETGGGNYSFTINTLNPDGTQAAMAYELFTTDLLFLFPQFIPQFSFPEFNERLQLFFESELPVHLAASTALANSAQLSTLLPAFASWHDSLRFESPLGLNKTVYAEELLTQLNLILQPASA